MNCCSKGGIQESVPNSHIHVQIIHCVRGLSFVDFSDDRENCFRARHGIWKHVQRVWPLFSFIGIPRVFGFAGCSQFPFSGNFSDKSPCHILFMTAFFCCCVRFRRCSVHQPVKVCIAASLEHSKLCRISNFFSSCFQVSLLL